MQYICLDVLLLWYEQVVKYQGGYYNIENCCIWVLDGIEFIFDDNGLFGFGIMVQGVDGWCVFDGNNDCVICLWESGGCLQFGYLYQFDLCVK